MLWDRRRDLIYDDAGVRAKWGVPPASVPDRLALVGDASDGFPGLPGWGDKSASAVLARYGHLEDIPAERERLGRARARGTRSASPPRSATGWTRRSSTGTSRACARPPTACRSRRRTSDELRWEGADRARWEAFCDAWGLPRLRARPHRWREG